MGDENEGYLEESKDIRENGGYPQECRISRRQEEFQENVDYPGE